jgi:hypothetical protein
MVLGDTTYYNMIIHDSPASLTMDGLKKKVTLWDPRSRRGVHLSICSPEGPLWYRNTGDAKSPKLRQIYRKHVDEPRDLRL